MDKNNPLLERYDAEAIHRLADPAEHVQRLLAELGDFKTDPDVKLMESDRVVIGLEVKLGLRLMDDLNPLDGPPRSPSAEIAVSPAYTTIETPGGALDFRLIRIASERYTAYLIAASDPRQKHISLEGLRIGFFDPKPDDKALSLQEVNFIAETILAPFSIEDERYAAEAFEAAVGLLNGRQGRQQAVAYPAGSLAVARAERERGAPLLTIFDMPEKGSIDESFAVLNISIQTNTVLSKDNGILTVRDLMKYGGEYVDKLSGIGPGRRAEIDEALAERGWKLMSQKDMLEHYVKQTANDGLQDYTELNDDARALLLKTPLGSLVAETDTCKLLRRRGIHNAGEMLSHYSAESLRNLKGPIKKHVPIILESFDRVGIAFR